MNLKKIVNRILRILSGKKGIYGEIGSYNHFSEGVLIYENAHIGNNNYVAPYVMINNAKIGNFCSLGPNSKIGLGEHDYCAISTLPDMNNGYGRMKLYNLEKPSVLGCDVWVGANAVIKQGVTIGTGAVIGANSVVTKDIPAYAIAIGAPAAVIKYRFDEENCNKIIDSGWFYKSFTEAQEIVKKLSDNIVKAGVRSDE